MKYKADDAPKTPWRLHVLRRYFTEAEHLMQDLAVPSSEPPSQPRPMVPEDEPSMDEILATLRNIISPDTTGLGNDPTILHRLPIWDAVMNIADVLPSNAGIKLKDIICRLDARWDGALRKDGLTDPQMLELCRECYSVCVGISGVDLTLIGRDGRFYAIDMDGAPDEGVLGLLLVVPSRKSPVGSCNP